MTKAKAGMNNETCVWAELTEWVVLFQAMISLQSQYKHVISAHVIFPLYLDKKKNTPKRHLNWREGTEQSAQRCVRGKLPIC